MSEAPAAGGLTIGTTVGNYRIQEKIGEGGMGAVYLAAHPLLGRKAAVKVLLPEHSKKADLVTRFFNEAKTAASLRHPALVEVFDFGFLPDGSGYIVMDYLEGDSLSARLTRVAPLAPEVAAEIARQLAAGVAAAHSQGIVHRDLKPDNIFLVPDPEQPERERVKILDFGIAKLVLPSGLSSKGATSTGMLLGTPLFMAPEQCRGAGTVDHRADIYSVGCILYNMLTGHPPFDREGVGEILAAHLHEAVTPPRALDPSLPEALEAIVLRALSKRPEDRQQSMAELAAELQGFLYPGGVSATSGQLARPSSLMAAAPRVSAGPMAAAPPRVSAGPVPVAASAPPSEGPRPQAQPGVQPVAAGGRTGVLILLALLLVGGAAGGGAYLLVRQRGAGKPPAVASAPTTPTSSSTPTPTPTLSPTPTEPAPPAASPPVVATASDPEPTEASAEPEPAPADEAPPATTKPDPTPAGTGKDPPRPRRPRPERQPGPGARALALALEQRSSGDEAGALRSLERALTAEDLSPQERSAAEKDLIGLRRKFGFVEVVCGQRGVEVMIDGQPKGRTPLDRPLLVRPGRHKVELRGTASPVASWNLTVAAAEKVAVKCR